MNSELYCFISFTSCFFNWKEDFSVVSNNTWYSVLTDSEIKTQNSLGKLGALLSYSFIYMFAGISSFFIPIFFALAGIYLLGYNIISIKKYIRESIWGLIWIPIFIYHVFGKDYQIFSGAIGVHNGEYLIQLIGNIGTSLLLCVILMIFITLKFNINLEKIRKFINYLKPQKIINHNKEEIKINIPKQKIESEDIEPIKKDDQKKLDNEKINLNVTKDNENENSEKDNTKENSRSIEK